jgi:hypothetical protein
MPNEVALRREPAESGLEDAEACVREACALLVCGDPAGMEQAGGQLRKAIEIFTGWQGQPPVAHSPCRLELHRSVQHAGRLLGATGRWCQHRQWMLFPEAASPPCYGADGRAVAAPAAGSMTLQG